MPNAAAGIGNVAAAPRDDVNVSVRDRLPSRLAAIDANVKTVDPGFCAHVPGDPVNELEQALPLVSRESLEPLDVPARDDEHVSVTDRELVRKGESGRNAGPGCGDGDPCAEGAAGHYSSISRARP